MLFFTVCTAAQIFTEIELSLPINRSWTSTSERNMRHAVTLLFPTCFARTSQ